MRNLARLLAAVSLAVAFPASATNGMRMIGFGAVQDSMGGVGVGATLDACSLLSNPAGIADLGWRLDVGGSFFKPTVKYAATGSIPVMAFDGQSLDSNRGGSPIPAIGYVHPVNEQLSVGVGVFGVAGMGVDYGLNLYGGPSYTSYLQGRLTPGVAYKLMDNLSVGATLNVMVAQMKYDVASGFGQALHDTATALGIGGTFGVKYSPVKRVTFGAAYETRSYFQDFKFDIPARTLPATLPPPYGGMALPAGQDRLAFDQPQSATVGVAVTPIDMLLLAIDVQWIDWASTMGHGLPRYTNDITQTFAQPFNMGWGDQWVVKFGTQVSPTAGLKLRAGYNYGKMPLDPNRAFENLVFPAVAEHHVTAGVGYDVSDKLALNLTGMYAFNAKLQGSNPDVPPIMGGSGQGIAAYSTEMSQFEIDLGVAFRF